MTKVPFLCITLIFFLPIRSIRSQVQVRDSIITMKDIVVLASRKPESLMAAPTSAQVIGKRFLSNSASPSFFDALSNAKGMQMITPSMGFRILNTRGFNNTTNVRFVQLVDGLDVQSPHIGSPIGNALGPSDLDIEKVEILPGVAATLYGMNAINGLADFSTRDPFTDHGLSFMQKTAISHLGHAGDRPHVFTESAFRYATAWGSHWAMKLNYSFMQGHDWIADDRSDLNPLANVSTGLMGADNPAADPANGYGNESSNRRTLALGGRNYVVARTGYYERDVVDYCLKNMKGDFMLKWRNGRGTEWSYTGRFAMMDNVYQRSNRFRLQDYLLQQHAIQFRMKGLKGNLYYNGENTGNSYNLRSMAENLDRSWKSDARWFTDYSAAFNGSANVALSLAQRHALARSEADKGRYVPGTPLFEEQLRRLKQINNWDSGAALKVQAAFIQADVQWDATESGLKRIKTWTGIDVIAGLDFRQYITMPDGNYFINPFPGKSGQDLLYKKAGTFVSLQKELFQKKVKLGFALRADKNDYFRMYFSPRMTGVWRPSTRTTLRANAQVGYRFPIIFEAFSNVNSGGVKRVGGLPVMSSGIFENGWIQTSIAAFQAAVLSDMNVNGNSLQQAIQRNAGRLQRSPYTYLRPEKVRSVELGFRQILANGRILIDADAYLNQYNAFIAQVNMNVPNTLQTDSIPFYLYDKNKQKPYRMWTNSTSLVRNYGFGVAISYSHPRSFMVTTNINYAKLSKLGQQDGLEDGFNTPAWTTVVSVSTNEWIKSWKAGLTWRWQDRFQWVSFLVTGEVPAYHTLDAFVEHAFSRQPIRMKLGASNLLNTPYRSFLGGPSVGGFYYLSVTFGVK